MIAKWRDWLRRRLEFEFVHLRSGYLMHSKKLVGHGGQHTLVRIINTFAGWRPGALGRIICCAALAGMLAGCAAAQAGADAPTTEPFPPATPQAVVAVSKQIFPAVVRIDVAQEIYRDGKRTVQRGIGSGVIIDDDGHILTNFHVAGRAAELYVTLYTKERVSAKLIGDDHWTDLAIIQMNANEVKAKNIKFTHVEFGESKTLIPGQDVMAIGTPFGLARTMTLGTVSNSERTFYDPNDPDGGMHIDEYETGEFSNWIQMDTPINPGNSGGPLVDMTGKLIGINTRGGGQNLNFAIPVDTAKEVIAKILATATPEKKGRVDRSDLGIDLMPLQDLEAFYSVDINHGVLVNNVERLGAAEKAGVKSQDILLSVDNKPTNVRFPEELAPTRKMIADIPIGTTVELTVKRGKQILHLTAVTLKLQSAVGEEKEYKDWGISAREVTRAYANEQQLDDAQGVVVTTMSGGYPAAEAELEPGDIIREVDGKPVTDLDEFTKLYDESRKSNEKNVLLNIQRGRARISAVLKMAD
jgi:serine protease Do